MFEKRLLFKIDEGQQIPAPCQDISISLKFFDNNNTVQLKFSGGPSAIGGQSARATRTIGLAPKSLTFAITAQSGRDAACAITCLGTSVGNFLSECSLKNESITEIENCLKGKAAEALANAVAGIGACLGII
jgi:hypothetical protein